MKIIESAENECHRTVKEKGYIGSFSVLSDISFYSTVRGM